MRAETLGDAGHKLELLNKMLEREKSYQERTRKIQARINSLLAGKLKRRKRKKLIAVQERLPEKLKKSESIFRQMKNRKEELYKNLIMQREALGITDHTWIHEFYGDKE